MDTFYILSKRVSVSAEGRQSCGWGCLSVTWPDDSLQQRHPASQKLKVCLQVVEHLQANVLSESSDRGDCVRGVETPARVLGLLATVPTPCPRSEVRWEFEPPTFDPCLKLTLPQASYSPWIPIIVSRIKTLSAKIFSASLIWCIPSPCEDRYSRQGKEHKPKNCSPRCKSFCFSQYSSAVRRLKQSTYLPSTLWHLSVSCVSLYFPHSLAMLLHEVSLCHAGLANISMHITDQPHVGDITQLDYTLPGFRFDHAICIQPGKYFQYNSFFFF